MSNYVTVDSKWSDIALAWAKENCPTYVTNDFYINQELYYDTSKINFFFHDSEQGRREMTMFALKWEHKK